MIFPQELSLTRSLLCPQSSFTHYGLFHFRRFAALNDPSAPFVSIRFSHFESTGCWIVELACEVEHGCGAVRVFETQTKTPASPLCSADAFAFFYIGRNHIRRPHIFLLPPSLRSQLQSFRFSSFLTLYGEQKIQTIL